MGIKLRVLFASPDEETRREFRRKMTRAGINTQIHSTDTLHKASRLLEGNQYDAVIIANRDPARSFRRVDFLNFFNVPKIKEMLRAFEAKPSSGAASIILYGSPKLLGLPKGVTYIRDKSGFQRDLTSTIRGLLKSKEVKMRKESASAARRRRKPPAKKKPHPPARRVR